MIRLIGIIVMALALAACGSGSDEDKMAARGVEITCMDANTDEAEACEGNLAVSALGVTSVEPVIYNAGDITVGTWMYALTNVTNFGLVNAPIYMDTAFMFTGCAEPPDKTGTYRIDLEPGGIYDAKTGILVELLPSKCLQLGPASITTTVYNASHLAYDELGDPSVDEPLEQGILYYNLVNSGS